MAAMTNYDTIVLLGFEGQESETRVLPPELPRQGVSSTSFSLCLSLKAPASASCALPPLLCVLISGETSGTRERTHFTLVQPFGATLIQHPIGPHPAEVNFI